jgi:hypothetical protein
MNNKKAKQLRKQATEGSDVNVSYSYNVPINKRKLVDSAGGLEAFTALYGYSPVQVTIEENCARYKYKMLKQEYKNG